MFRRKLPQVRVGDRFTKTGGATTKVWTVMGILEASHHLPHAQLASETPSPENITISIQALIDGALFRPVTPASEGA
jgi:hypothetical protein